MDNRLILGQSGAIYMDVTDQQVDIPEKLCDGRLFTEFRKEGYSEMIPIIEKEDMDRAMEAKQRIAIYVGSVPDHGVINNVTIESWERADKIQHQGFVYVRYSDLRFCK
jgi:hypothetical protein